MEVSKICYVTVGEESEVIVKDLYKERTGLRENFILRVAQRLNVPLQQVND